MSIRTKEEIADLSKDLATGLIKVSLNLPLPMSLPSPRTETSRSVTQLPKGPSTSESIRGSATIQDSSQSNVQKASTSQPSMPSQGVMKMSALDELANLGAISTSVKVATYQEYQDASSALKRLKKLKEQKITPEEASTGAMLGAATFPVMQYGRRALTGEGMFGLRKTIQRGVEKAAPKLLSRRGLFQAGRDLAANMAYGAALGGGLPVINQLAQAEAEKARIREYLGERPHSKLQRAAAPFLGRKN